MSNPIQARNFIDRAIEAIAPRYANQRYAARAQLDMARHLYPAQASYRGAVTSRLSTPWSQSTSYRGGSSVDRRNMGTMRDRGRRIYRESPIGKSLLNTETDNVVADGFSLQMRTSSPEFNAEAEARFYQWLDRADVTGMRSGAELFRTSWREPRKDGDGGFILIERGGRPYLQYIPGDLIVSPRKGFDPKTTFDGVECDPTGKPIRFHIRDVDESGRDTVTPIDARDFVYLAHLEDPMAVRGATVYSSIFTLLDQIDSYVDAVIIAARMACIFGLIQKTAKPNAMTAGLGLLPNSQGEQQKAITLENGMLKVHGTEDSVYQVQAQQPMNQTPDFIRAIFRLICLPFDMPLEIGQKDLSQVNFSGGRIGLIAYYRSCRVKQDWMKSRCWNRIAFWWLSKERQRQQLGYPDAFKTPFPDDYGNFLWHGREWDYNDPVTEAQADLLEVSMGILSEQQACEKRGRDWLETQNQIEESRKIKSEKNIPIVLSNYTRDERQRVTAVDAQGNPVEGSAQPLNGIQITAAMDVLAKLSEKTITLGAAVEMLERLGIAPDKAQAVAAEAAANRSGISTSDRDYQRDVLKTLLSVPAAREAVYNATDIEDLIAQTGLPAEKGIQVPFIPVVAATGPLVSGATILDPEGDIVGGDVENAVPMDSPGDGGSTRNAAPPADTTPETDAEA